MRRIIATFILSCSLLLALAGPALADARPSGYGAVPSRLRSAGDVKFVRGATEIFSITSTGIKLAVGAFSAAAGSAAAPSISFVTDPNTGLYTGGDVLGIAAGGVLRALVNAAGITSKGDVSAEGSLVAVGGTITAPANLTIAPTGGEVTVTGTVGASVGSLDGYAVCWAGTQLGYCSSGVNVDGTCTCNPN